jgi:tetratricopeptide (TPR) repeat protein
LRLAQGHIEVKALELDNGGCSAKTVYELVGTGPARTRFKARAERGLTGFVGRSTETEQIERAQVRARQGHGQVVAIIGEAGLGKSRLLYEFIHSGHTAGWLVLEAATLSHRTTTSYQPVIELLKAHFRIADGDQIEAMRVKVMDQLLGLDRDLASDAPALLALLDVPVEDASWQDLEPFERRQRTLNALKRLVLRECQRQPVILAFEDLHWIDSETQAFVDTLIDGLPSAPLLLIVTYRPEYQHRWGSKSTYTQVRLEALSPEATQQFLRNLIGDHASLVRLKELLPRHGNPFFLEESIRSLVETDLLEGKPGGYRLVASLPELRIPPSVQAIVAARIDRLPTRGKRLLQAASVVGRDVPRAILQPVAGLDEDELRCGLAELQEAEFLYEARLFPDLEYTFKHALTHDVAYGSLLGEQRRVLHCRIVDAIEQLYPDRLIEQVERLAHHALHGEAWEKAVRYLRQAGSKAEARSAPHEAKVWLEHAIATLQRMPESRFSLEQAFDVRLQLRPVLAQLGEPQAMLERLREAEILAEQLNDDHRRGRAWALMANAYGLLGKLDEASASGSRALAIANALGDFGLSNITTYYAHQIHYYRGEYLQAVELAVDNIAAIASKRLDNVYENLRGPVPAAIADRMILTMSLAELGRITEAAAHATEAFRLAEPTRHAFALGQAYRGAVVLHLAKGEWAKARSLIEDWTEVVRTGNLVIQLPIMLVSSAWVLAELGKARDAMNRIREGEKLLERQAAQGLVILLGTSYHALSRACLRLGCPDDAYRLAERAVGSSSSQPGFAAHALHLLGEIATYPDRFNPQAGEAYYQRALGLAEPRGMRPLIAHCHRGLGELYRRAAEPRMAAEHLDIAKRMFSDMDMRFWLQTTGEKSRA